MANDKVPQVVFSVTLVEKYASAVRNIPKFLRGVYIAECVARRLDAEGPPKYTDEQLANAGQNAASKRAMTVILRNPAMMAQVAALHSQGLGGREDSWLQVKAIDIPKPARAAVKGK